MSFPVRIAGQVLGDLGELVALLEQRGRANVGNRPGQLVPAESFARDLDEPSKAAVLAEACAVLLRRSGDARVLQLCVHLGGRGHLVFYEAVVDRLASGPPIPAAPGYTDLRLLDAVADTLVHTAVASSPDLHRRASAVLAARGLTRVRVQLLGLSDPHGELADALVAALRTTESRTGSLAPWLVALHHLARRDPTRLLEVGEALAGHGATMKGEAVITVSMAAPAWWSQHEGAFRAAMQ